MSACNDISGMQSHTRLFSVQTANAVQKHIAAVSRNSIQAVISWKDGSETAVVAFEIKDASNRPQRIQIHGEYYKLCRRISEIVGVRK